MNFRLLYPEFKKKAYTFSYDDGVIYDKNMIEIFNKYNVKATFNLNYGKSKEEKVRIDKKGNLVDCSYLNLDKDFHIYDNFEITSHSFSHPHMENISYEEQLIEIKKNKDELSKLFSKNIDAFCYPYGTYNSDTIKALKEMDTTYSRTTRSTYRFNLPSNFLLWNPTIHHRDSRLFEIINNFKNNDEELSLLYIWGHSYEFALDSNFDLLEKIILELKNQNDCISLTNGEIYKYVNAANMVYYRDNKFINPSDEDIFIECDGNNLKIEKKGSLNYEK